MVTHRVEQVRMGVNRGVFEAHYTRRARSFWRLPHRGRARRCCDAGDGPPHHMSIEVRTVRDNLNLQVLEEIAAYFRSIRAKYSNFEGSLFINSLLIYK